MKPYKLAALGGTFDHFHEGHKTLIQHALMVAEKVIIGVTDESLTNHKQFLRSIQPYEIRIRHLREYVSQLALFDRVQFVKLHDVFGPTVEANEIDVLVVSPLTQSGAAVINSVREEKGLNVLPVEVCHMEKAVDGDHISSTRVRQGEISRVGFVYGDLLKQSIEFNDHQKHLLKNPFGTLYINGERERLVSELKDSYLAVHDDHSALVRTWIIAVGDETALWCHDRKIPVYCYVFDNKTKRKELEQSIQKYLPASEIIRVKNPAGMVSYEMSNTIQLALTEKKNVRVIGEEDLAFIPMVLLAPLGTILLYGQPDEGLVKCVVDEEKKEWVRELLSE